MSYLKKALQQAGVTQAELARSLGVSDGAVNHWVTGKRPIPEDRIPQIEGLLSTDLSGVVVNYETLLKDGRTPIGYAIMWSLDCPVEGWVAGQHVPRSAEDLKRRVKLWSRHLSITSGELEQVILGNQLIPLTDALVIGEQAQHVRNPVIFAEQVGYEIDERTQVTIALEKLADEAQTFAEAFNRLGEIRKAVMAAPLQHLPVRAAQDLDNGSKPDDIQWWLDGEEEPDGWKPPVNLGQNHDGRFKSGGNQ